MLKGACEHVIFIVNYILVQVFMSNHIVSY